MGAKLRLLSKRDDNEIHWISKRYGLKPIRMIGEGNYISIKRASLGAFRETLPKGTTIVYVGDRSEDFIVAFFDGFIYCSPSALSEEIFQDAEVGQAILCGGECGKKGYFEGHAFGVM